MTEHLYRVLTAPNNPRAFCAGFVWDGSKVGDHAPILKRWINRKSLADTISRLKRSNLTIERVS